MFDYDFVLDEVVVGKKYYSVSGTLDFEVEEGQDGTWEDPPLADIYHVTHVCIDKVYDENANLTSLWNRYADAVEYVQGWFQGDEGQEMLRDRAMLLYNDRLTDRLLDL